MNQTLRVFAFGALSTLAFLPTVSHAARKKVRELIVDKYQLYEGGGTKGPGMNIVFHYETNAEFAKQDLFKAENLRWFQRLSCSDDVGLLTPRPNRPFIDLRKGQLAPGHPNGEGDDLPFYDFSYPTRKDADTNKNIKIDGSGVYMRDDPRAQQQQRSIRFEFETFVVGNIEDKLFSSIGGFKWGFDVDKDGKLTALKVEPFTDEYICLSKWDFQNTTLRKDFSDWAMPSQKSWGKDDQYYFGVSGVPEPGSLGALALGVLTSLQRRRNKPS